MHLIVGLGNPGRRYEATRHNVGFRVADRLSASLRARFTEGKGDFFVARGELEDVPFAILKPSTFMNDSGIAVRDAAVAYGATPGETLIVYDDFQLPLGSIRLRPRGTDGGHNGMASVIYHAQTDEIPRLRCGIGQEGMTEAERSATDFVLSPFEADELPAVDRMVDRAVEGIRLYLGQGIEAAMNTYNRNSELNA